MSGRIVEREDFSLLLDLWERERRLEYPVIRNTLEAMPRAAVVESEELSLLLLLAYVQLKEPAKAMVLATELRAVFTPSRTDRNYRRYLNMYAHLCQVGGQLSAGLALVEELREKAQVAGDEVHHFHAVLQLMVVAGLRGDFVESLRHGYHSLALARTVEGGRWAPAMHHNLAISCRELGLVAEAHRHFELAARHDRPDWMVASTHLDRALLLQAVGDVEAAAEIAQNALATFHRLEALNGVAEAHLVLAKNALRRGSLSDAAAHLNAAGERLDGAEPLLVAQFHEDSAALHLLSGNGEAFDKAAAVAEELYRTMEAPWRAERMRTRMNVLGYESDVPGDGHHW